MRKLILLLLGILIILPFALGFQLNEPFNDSSINSTLWIQNYSGTVGTPSWTETTSVRLKSATAGGASFDAYVFLQGNKTLIAGFDNSNADLLITAEVLIYSARSVCYVNVRDINNVANYISFGVTTEPGMSVSISYNTTNPNKVSWYSYLNTTLPTGATNIWYNMSINISNNIARFNVTNASGFVGERSINWNILQNKDLTLDVGAVGRANAGEIPDCSIKNLKLDYNPFIPASIILKYPANNSLISTTNINFTADFNITSARWYNWTNATYYVWKNGVIFNETYVNLGNNRTNLSYFLPINNFVVGNYKWNVLGWFGNSSYKNFTYALSNYTFEVGAITEAESYSATTYETSTENFQINITMFPGTSLISAYLWYNGTSYSVSDISTTATGKSLKKIIDIPLNLNLFLNETKNFFWSFTFSNTGLIPQNTSINTQNISFINLQLCNITYTNTAVNFTIKDEKNPNPKINASFHSNWQYWLGDGNIKKNYSFEDTSVTNSSFKFCISPQNRIFNADADIEYSSLTAFPERTRYLRGAALSNITSELNLFLLNSSMGVKFFFTLTQNLAPFTNALVTISKYDVGVGNWITIGIRKSDDTGKFIEYLELDKEYRFSIVKDGIFMGIIDKTSTCSATPCEIELELTTAKTDLWSGYYSVMATNVAYNLSYNRDTKNITFTFVDLTGLAQYFRLQVDRINYNQTEAIICNITTYTTAGTIKCDLTGYTGNFRADAFISRSPEKWIAVIFAIISAIRDVIGIEGIFFTFLIVVTLAFVGFYNPVVGIILTTAAIILSFFMGFLAISYTGIILIVILAVFLITKMGGGGRV